jgi:hypothetical protein
MNPVEDLLMYAAKVAQEGSPTTRASRDAAHSISGLKFNKEEMGVTKFGHVLALRSLCVGYRRTPATQHENVLKAVKMMIQIVHATPDAPDDFSGRRPRAD